MIKSLSYNRKGTHRKPNKAIRIAIPIEDGYLFRNSDEILYCIALEQKTEFVFVEDAPIIIERELKHVIKVMDDPYFCQIHPNYYVNFQFAAQFIKKDIGGNLILKNKKTLPVGEAYKNGVIDFFKHI